MDEVFKKLNYKGQKKIIALNCPLSFRVNLDSVEDEADIVTDLKGAGTIEFMIFFATRKAEVDETMNEVGHRLAEDAVLWVAYPKGTSKKYKCDFNRDNGWDAMKPFKLESVRMVAIDEDWCALRFRNSGKVKSKSKK